MSLADGIYTLLKAREAIVAAVGDDIYHIGAEDANPDNYIVFEEIGEQRLRPFVSSPVLCTTRVTFECWAGSRVVGETVINGDATAASLAQEVYDCFIDPNGDGSGNFTGSMGGVYVQDVRHESARAMFDETAKKWGREIDLTFDYRL